MRIALTAGLSILALAVLLLARMPERGFLNQNGEGDTSLGGDGSRAEAGESYVYPTAGVASTEPVNAIVEVESPPGSSFAVESVEPEVASPWPVDMELRIFDYLAQHADLEITNIQRVECKESVCEIEIYGATVTKAEDAAWVLLQNIPEEEWNVADIEIRKVDVFPQVEAMIIELFPEVDQAD